MTPAIALVVEAPEWRKGTAGLLPQLRRAARLAWLQGSPENRVRNSLTILLTDDARLHALNLDFRGKDKPTNVLSFSASQNREDYVGDIALAYGVTCKEAKAAAKLFADHACHLVVHGVLHLAGFDHDRDPDAEAMEALEVKILSRLGIEDPYRVRVR